MDGTDRLISIITVSYNAVSTIEQTLHSVIDQTYEGIEYIVIDGGSTDGTTEVIRSCGSSLSNWISEPDRGIADAMNKGLSRATGRYVLYLNADDYLIDPGAVERIAWLLEGVIVAAPIIKLGRNNDERLIKPRGFNWWFNLKTGLFHQATFCLRQMVIELGGFDNRCNLEMDYDMFLRAYRHKMPVRIIDEPFSVMREGGVSTRNDVDTLKRRFKEEKSIHYRHCPNVLMKVFYFLYWRVYPTYRLLRARTNMPESNE